MKLEPKSETTYEISETTYEIEKYLFTNSTLSLYLSIYIYVHYMGEHCKIVSLTWWFSLVKQLILWQDVEKVKLFEGTVLTLLRQDKHMLMLLDIITFHKVNLADWLQRIDR